MNIQEHTGGNRPAAIEDLPTLAREDHEIVSAYGLAHLTEYEAVEIAWIKFRSAAKKAGLAVTSTNVTKPRSAGELEEALKKYQAQYDRGLEVYHGEAPPPRKDVAGERYSTDGMALAYYVEQEGLEWPEPEDLGHLSTMRAIG